MSDFMQLAVTEARKNLVDMQGGPFGACLVKEGKVLAVARNTVLTSDATCHAEINAIREASEVLGTHDLTGCEIYSTTEPCPMCFSAIHWAKISRIYYGTSIADVQERGFNELSITNQQMKEIGKSQLEIVPDFEKEACLALLQEWDALPSKQTY